MLDPHLDEAQKAWRERGHRTADGPAERGESEREEEEEKAREREGQGERKGGCLSVCPSIISTTVHPIDFTLVGCVAEDPRKCNVK